MSNPNFPKELFDIMKQVFNPADLVRFTHWYMNEYLHNISSPYANHETQVNDLIDWASRHGYFDKLLRSAQKERPNNTQLEDLLKAWNASQASAARGGNAQTVPSAFSVSSNKVSAMRTASQKVAQLAMQYEKVMQGDPMDRVEEQENRIRELNSELAKVHTSNKEGQEDSQDGFYLLCFDPNPQVRHAAVRRLREEPSLLYLHWLAERIELESNEIATDAVQALLYFAAKAVCSDDTTKVEATYVATAEAIQYAARHLDDKELLARLTISLNRLKDRLENTTRDIE